MECNRIFTKSDFQIKARSCDILAKTFTNVVTASLSRKVILIRNSYKKYSLAAVGSTSAKKRNRKFVENATQSTRVLTIPR